MQRDGGAGTNPAVAKCPQRFISHLILLAGKHLQLQVLSSDIVRNLSRSRDQIVGPQIRFERFEIRVGWWRASGPAVAGASGPRYATSLPSAESSLCVADCL
jgi:hypothetical protein